MNVISTLVKKIDTKTEHDLVRSIVGLIVGFVVAKLVENAYDSALGTGDDNEDTSTDD